MPNTPENFKDKLLQPYITQFYGVNRKGGQTVGGYAPQFSASIYKKLSIENHVIDEKNLVSGTKLSLILDTQKIMMVLSKFI